MTQQVTIATVLPVKTPLSLAFSTYNSKSSLQLPILTWEIQVAGTCMTASFTPFFLLEMISLRNY